MKQTCTLLVLLLVLISCGGEPTTLNAGVVISKSGNVSKKHLSYNDEPFGFLNFLPVDTNLQIGAYIRCMYQDKSGNIWFGTYGNGISRYNGKTVVSFTKKGIAGNVIRDIIEDATGNIWFATNGGIYVYDGKELTNYSIEDGLNSNEVWDILIDKSVSPGRVRIWFATDAGICRYDGKQSIEKELRKDLGRFSNFKLPESELNNIADVYPSSKLVNCIFQSKNGTIWFGTNGRGVYRYNKDKSVDGNHCDEDECFINISDNDGLCNNFIQSIYEDKTGNLWFCSRFGGVSHYDGKSFANFTTANGLHSNFVWCVFENKPGEFWIATAGEGISIYDGKSFNDLTEKDGLSSNYVQSILKDKDGNLWLGTSLGLCRYEPNALLRKDGKSFISYNKNEDGC